MKNRNYYIMQINIFDEISFSGSFYNTWKKRPSNAGSPQQRHEICNFNSCN